MPILWRYLLKEYLRTLVLCVAAFIAILLTMRLDEIANFATLSPDLPLLFVFILQQIPYILPITFPIASLISSILITQRLSQSQELTAARACGFSLKDLLLPIIALSLVLSALNFYIVSEIATQSHLNAAQLKNELRAVNPLLLIHNKTIMRMKGFYFDTLGASHLGEFAQDIILLAPSNQSERVNVLIAKELKFQGDKIFGDHVTLISDRQSDTAEGSTGLLVENMAQTEMTTQEFSDLLERSTLNIKPDHLKMSYLLIALKEPREDRARVITEIMRRISVGISVFTFTLMGLAFGISIGRHRSGMRILYVVLLASFYLVSFFVAKEFDQSILISSIFYFLPHIVITILSCVMLYRVSIGRE
jgi:lipopolysaccharide export system permease protein